MPWEQLKQYIKENRERRALELTTPPVACPIDGEILTVHPRTAWRRCPLGNFTWTGGPSFV